jgi:hypothetical protein
VIKGRKVELKGLLKVKVPKILVWAFDWPIDRWQQSLHLGIEMAHPGHRS